MTTVDPFSHSLSSDVPFRLPVLPPMGNSWVVGLASADLVSPDDCERISADAADDVAPEIDVAVVERVIAMLRQANDDYFRFELSGAIAEAEPMVVELHDGQTTASVGLGLRGDASTRKLIALVPLAFERAGGALVVPFVGKTEPLKVGQGHVWPAFLDARIDLAGEGTLRALVAHAFGPAFR